MNSTSSWLSTRWWILVVAASACLAIWSHSSRITKVDYVSNLAGGDSIALDADSATGYESGFRKLVVPERNADSFQWIMQVQEMFESGRWRLQHVDYDNSPDGRSVRTASAYRWWLGSVAWIHHKVTGDPIGISVERAALLADPIAQTLLLLASAIFIARYFNAWGAGLFSLGFVTIFPLGSAFVPGQPDEFSLLLACTLWSVLPLAAAILKLAKGNSDATGTTIRGLFLLAGIAAGTGLWFGTAGMLPILTGIAAAAIFANLTLHKGKADSTSGSEPLPWRLWATGGAATILFFWLIDRSPAFLDASSWQSDFVHPLYAIAWWGMAEILVWTESRQDTLSRARILVLSVAALSICGLAYTILFHGSAVGWNLDPIPAKLTRLALSPESVTIGGWYGEAGGPTGMLLVTLLPLALVGMAITILIKSRNVAADYRALAIVVVPSLVAVGYATTQLGWWNQTGALALLVGVVILATRSSSLVVKLSSKGIMVIAAMSGFFFVYSGLDSKSSETVEQSELETLLERRIAQWLAKRSNPSENGALASPNVSVSLAYFGGLRVLGTPYPENADGFAVAVRLSAASSADEARALVSGREISLVVHPSWDTFLEDYARLGTEEPENSFIAMLNRWLPPRWLEPVEFALPKVPGFENEWVTIFRTGEVRDNTSAIGRLVEYFLYTGRGELAMRAQQTLSSNFQDDLVTHITAAQLAIAASDMKRFRDSTEEILEAIKAGTDFYLPWEFRASMSLVLAGAKQTGEAKKQLERCLEEADRNSIARLSEGTLSGILRLAKVLNVEFPDPELKEYALSLLPKDQSTNL